MKKWQLQILLLLTVTLWSSAFVGIRFSMHEFSYGGLLLLRLVIASGIMTVLYKFCPNKVRISLYEKLLCGVYGAIGIGGFNLFLNVGEKTLDSALASFIASQYPLVATALAIFFFKEKITKMGFVGLGLSVTGTLIILLAQAINYDAGDGIIALLFALLCAGLYAVLQKPILKKISGLQFASYALWGATCFAFIYSADFIHDIQHVSTGSMLTVIYLGIFPTAIAYTLWSYCLSKTSASYAVAYNYCMPFITMLLAMVFLHEMPTLGVVLGGCIAMLGIVVKRFAGEV